MKILLCLLVLAANADARGRKDPSCPEGFSTFVETRISGAANPSLQRHRIKNRKLFNKYDCKRCPRGSITIVDGSGWNICLGGRTKDRCGAHAAPVPTGDPQNPKTCVPCGVGERKVVVNGQQQCLPHRCENGTAPARYRGVVESYRCTEPFEDPDLIVWATVTPPAPKTQPETPECGDGEGLSWEASDKTYSCQPCGADLIVLKRNGYPICGKKTAGLCGKREAYIPTVDLTGRSRCEYCPKRYRFSMESGVPRCLKPTPKPKKKRKKKKQRSRMKKRGSAGIPTRN